MQLAVLHSQFLKNLAQQLKPTVRFPIPRLKSFVFKLCAGDLMTAPRRDLRPAWLISFLVLAPAESFFQAIISPEQFLAAKEARRPEDAEIHRSLRLLP